MVDYSALKEAFEKYVSGRLTADEVSISGCPNACSGHWASRVGIGCLNQRAGGEVVVRGKLVSGADAADGVPRLSEEEHDGLHDVAALVASAVRRMKEMAGGGVRGSHTVLRLPNPVAGLADRPLRS